MGREEKWEGGDRGDMVEKNESTKRERAVKTVEHTKGSDYWLACSLLF